VPPGGSRLFAYPTEDDPCILVRDASGRFDAFSQVCTHLSCAVVHHQADRTLACPCHKGSFSSIDGRPLAGPPTRRLPRIVIERRGADLVATGIEV
jgi:Rieske Fe-S protein